MRQVTSLETRRAAIRNLSQNRQSAQRTDDSSPALQCCDQGIKDEVRETDD